MTTNLFPLIFRVDLVFAFPKVTKYVSKKSWKTIEMIQLPCVLPQSHYVTIKITYFNFHIPIEIKNCITETNADILN